VSITSDLTYRLWASFIQNGSRGWKRDATRIDKEIVSNFILIIMTTDILLGHWLDDFKLHVDMLIIDEACFSIEVEDPTRQYPSLHHVLQLLILVVYRHSTSR